jgi:magnesium-transporting ATPase (P-type)
MLALNWVPQLNAVGKYFSIMPIIIVLASDAIKDLYEDIRRARQDDRINNREAQCYDKTTGQYYRKKWKHLQVGDVIKVVCKEEAPADILIIDTTDEFNFAYADTSTLDGETNLKQRTCAKIPDMESTGLRNLELEVSVDIPNDDLSKLNGYIHHEQQNVTLNLENFILRGSELRNTDYIVGLVVYAGHDTKAMQNNKGARTKMSNIERMMNGTIMIMCLILLSICFISAFGQWLWLRSYSHARVHKMTNSSSNSSTIEYKVAPYLTPLTQKIAYVAFLSFFTFVIIFNQLIPMSLYILLEVTKLLQMWLLQKDLDLFGTKAINCRSISIGEDLGQVQYIFTDKTGTLTENKMIFKCLTACRRVFGCSKTGKSDNLKTDDSGGVRPPVDAALAEALESKSDFEDCNSIMIAMTICNTVMVTSEGRRGTSFSQYLPRDFNRIVYEAESPDELSLVNAAREYGFILLRRTPESCVVRQQKTIMRYKVIIVIFRFAGLLTFNT